MASSSIPMIEFLKDKIYLGAYDYTPRDDSNYVYFTIDDVFPYHNFHHDFGPLSASHLYRFAILLHEILGDPKVAGKSVVFYSSTDPRLRANNACVLCCYMVLIQKWPPHLALAPISQANPPFTPFRDAGYSTADFELVIQDIVYGVWRAKEHSLLNLNDNFHIDAVEYYEQVENGDLNDIGPHFVAFASPVQKSRRDEPSDTFLKVLDYFTESNVQVVVRLNSSLYPRETFVEKGVKHIDLVFEDGTCPTMTYVHAFIGMVECVLKKDKTAKIAVHCRAGLGRTGCLIGAYLIYRYGFTAQEVIGYMRFLRPGMVVGPQQHWLYLHQNQFREWRHTMCVSSQIEPELANYSRLVAKGSVYGQSPQTPERKVLGPVKNTQTLPPPTPGQPRKAMSPSAGGSLSVRKTRGVEGTENGPASAQRTVTEFSQSQKREIGRQMRTVSNPSPRHASKRMNTPTSHPIPARAK